MELNRRLPAKAMNQQAANSKSVASAGIHLLCGRLYPAIAV
jgi:hypothetical protein